MFRKKGVTEYGKSGNKKGNGSWTVPAGRRAPPSGKTAGGPLGSDFCRAVCSPGNPDVELPVYGKLCQRSVHVFHPLCHYRSGLRQTEETFYNRGKDFLDADPSGNQSSIRLLHGVWFWSDFDDLSCGCLLDSGHNRRPFMERSNLFLGPAGQLERAYCPSYPEFFVPDTAALSVFF